MIRPLAREMAVGTSRSYCTAAGSFTPRAISRTDLGVRLSCSNGRQSGPNGTKQAKETAIFGLNYFFLPAKVENHLFFASFEFVTQEKIIETENRRFLCLFSSIWS